MTIYRKTTFWLGIILAVLLGYFVGWHLPIVSKVHLPTPLSSAYEKKMRELWQDQAIWTRMYLLGSTSSTDNLNRLLDSETTLGNSLAEYFDSNTADQFTALLKNQASLAVSYMNAVKTGKNIDSASQAWHANSAQVVDFLSGISPQISKDTLDRLWTGYINASQQEILFHYRGSTKQEISAFDQAENEILLFSDNLADAFEKQFPEKF